MRGRRGPAVRTILAAGVAAAITACGGSHHVATRSSSPTRPRPDTGQGAVTTTTRGAPVHSTSKVSVTRTTLASGPPVTPAPSGVPITVKLASPCVPPGGSQTITITTEPSSGVAYDAVYADGKNGTSKGYYGGNKGGQTDNSGVWTDTWVIAAGAPPGPVRVDIVAATPKGAGTTYAAFAMADASGRCAG